MNIISRKYFIGYAIFVFIFGFLIRQFPILNSHVVVRVLVTGTQEQLIQKRIFAKDIFDSGNPLSRTRGAILDFGFSNQIFKGENPGSFMRKDYPLALFRKILIDLFLPVILMLFMATIRYISLLNYIYAKYLSIIGITISVIAIIFLAIDSYFATNIFFPETSVFFFPLKIQPESDQYFARSYFGFMTLFLSLVALIYINNISSKLPIKNLRDQGVIQ
jgi:hypothetical protein